jgi:hypothetical protein
MFDCEKAGFITTQVRKAMVIHSKGVCLECNIGLKLGRYLVNNKEAVLKPTKPVLARNAK